MTMFNSKSWKFWMFQFPPSVKQTRRGWRETNWDKENRKEEEEKLRLEYFCSFLRNSLLILSFLISAKPNRHEQTIWYDGSLWRKHKLEFTITECFLNLFCTCVEILSFILICKTFLGQCQILVWMNVEELVN